MKLVHRSTIFFRTSFMNMGHCLVQIILLPLLMNPFLFNQHKNPRIISENKRPGCDRLKRQNKLKCMKAIILAFCAFTRAHAARMTIIQRHVFHHTSEESLANERNIWLFLRKCTPFISMNKIPTPRNAANMPSPLMSPHSL